MLKGCFHTVASESVDNNLLLDDHKNSHQVHNSMDHIARFLFPTHMAPERSSHTCNSELGGEYNWSVHLERIQMKGSTL